MSELDALGVEYTPSATKKVLEELLSLSTPVPEVTEELVEPVSAEPQPELEVATATEVLVPVEEVVPVEEEVVPVAVEAAENLGYLGFHRVPVTSIGRKSLNGREYVALSLADNTTMLLSDEEFALQHSK